MPRLMDQDQDQYQIGGGGAFQFSAVRPDELEETEYTLATIAIDVTGSVQPFADELLEMLRASVEACRKAPKAENLLLRVLLFSTGCPGGIEEVHGFKLLEQIDVMQDYTAFKPTGGTPLFDATYSAVGATEAYAKMLTDQDFTANGVIFIVTDGDDNSSAVGPQSVAQKVDDLVRNEDVEGVTTALIGINVATCRHLLEEFQREANLTQFIDAGDVTPSALAKIVGFISRSVSSTSQSLGTGTPSQPLTF